MAQINAASMDRVYKQRNFIHEEAPATYTVFTENGETYFQIDTYGRTDREHPEKISQSIQLNKDSARRITKLLIDTFDLL